MIERIKVHGVHVFEPYASWLGLDPVALAASIDRVMDEDKARHRTDRPARGRNNAAARRSGREHAAFAHACAAARLGIPKLPRKLKKVMWRDDPEYFC